LNGRIRIAIDVEPGNLTENIQVDRVREQVLELGLFREVSVELQARDGKSVLVIGVEVIANDIDIPAIQTHSISC
jgi:hypothetical protein